MASPLPILITVSFSFRRASLNSLMSFRVHIFATAICGYSREQNETSRLMSIEGTNHVFRRTIRRFHPRQSKTDQCREHRPIRLGLCNRNWFESWAKALLPPLEKDRQQRWMKSLAMVCEDSTIRMKSEDCWPIHSETNCRSTLIETLERKLRMVID